MRKTIRLMGVVVLVLAGCTGKAEEGAPSGGITLETSDRSSPRLEGTDMAMPEGTWTGSVHAGWGAYTVRVTLPATCTVGTTRGARGAQVVVGSERCGRQELTFPDGSTCGGPFVAVTSVGGGAFSFRDSFTYSGGGGGGACDPGWTRIAFEPGEGGELDYLTTGGHEVGGWGVGHGTLRPTGAA